MNDSGKIYVIVAGYGDGSSNLEEIAIAAFESREMADIFVALIELTSPSKTVKVTEISLFV